jgi:hypothetical protein
VVSTTGSASERKPAPALWRSPSERTARDTLYRPWVDALARRFRVVHETAGEAARPRAITIEPGTIVLFVDGLRMDVGRAVSERLSDAGIQAQFSWRLAPVPPVTATAKPLITPVADSVAGKGKIDAFLPLEISSGKPATTDVLQRRCSHAGFKYWIAIASSHGRR